MLNADAARVFCVDGVVVNIHSMRQALTAAVTSAHNGRGFSLFTLNLDHCNKLRADDRFRAAYRRAEFVTADGFPIVMLGRLTGARVKRTTGADLFEPLCAAAGRYGLPIFLVGPSAQVVTDAEARLRRRYANLRVAGAYAPGPNFDADSLEADLAIERIRQSGARLCFLAIGAPRQEIFAARCRTALPQVGFICVGAALDFIAGTQVRAPRAFRALNLEWLWRLSSNPRRLGARYLRCAAVIPRLVAGAIPQAIIARRGRPT